MSFERRITFEPAYDRRSDDPKRDYGIHGVTLRMALIGEKGATAFALFTNWQLPEVQDESDRRMGVNWRLGSRRELREMLSPWRRVKRSSPEDVAALLDAADRPPALNINVVRAVMKMDLPPEVKLRQISRLLEDNAARGGAVASHDPILFEVLYKPMPADLGVHSKTPQYEGQDPHGAYRYEYRDPTDEERAQGMNFRMPVPIPVTKLPVCELTGTLCYYDGSGLNAEGVFDVLLREGSDGVWRELEEYYKEVFEKEKEDDED